jgi:NOL1/NOP2/sun family putative RNA methylase
MKKSPQEKLAQKREAWVTRTAAVLTLSSLEADALLRTDRIQSLRINPLMGDRHQTVAALRTLGWRGNRYDWFIDGYTVESSIEPIRDSSLVAAGKVFIQNAASWLPVLALDPQKNEAILDVCAAPGGKTSHIAASVDNQAHIVANDNSRARLAKLRATMERLGATAEYSLYDASSLARKMEGRLFDKILLDTPCSGEGLMRLDRDADFTTWSVAHIKRLQQLQKRIITQSWQLLKPGGSLVYSTCTMAPEENEAVVDYLLRSEDTATIVPFDLSLPSRVKPVTEWNGRQFNSSVASCLRLKPSEHIEAFFVCKISKVASVKESML